jgi:glycosyltransferase involved in cell wall biosynthesis
MKIAFISQPSDIVSPHGQYCSLPIWTYEVARRVAKSCEVTVVSRRGVEQPIEWHEGVHHRRFPRITDLRGISGVRNRVLRRWSTLLAAVTKKPLNARREFIGLDSMLYYLSYSVLAAIHVRRHRYDVVHVMNFGQVASIIRAFNPRIKIVLHMHCTGLHLLEWRMIANRLRHINLILGCSDYVTHLARQRFPQYADRCHTLSNGVDIEHFGPADEPDTRVPAQRRLLFVGRVSPEKGVHVLIEAFARVKEHFPDVHLDIVGPTVGQLAYDLLVSLDDDDHVKRLSRFYDWSGECTYLRYLEHEVLRLGCHSHVTFQGSHPYHDLVRFYQHASACIVPSIINEPFGMPVIEAMACGVPVVASRSGGLTTVIEHEQTGLLVERDDPKKLADAICALLEDEERRTIMGQAGRERARKHFSWETISEQLLEKYSLMLQSSAASVSVGKGL